MLTTEQLIEKFTQDIRSATKAEVLARLTVQMGGFGSFAAPPKVVAANPAKKARRKAPVQLCPIKNCPRRAAPCYGMVCSVHKDLPKAKIKAARETRRKSKLA